MMLEMDLRALSRRIEDAVDVEEDDGTMLLLQLLRPAHRVQIVCFVLRLGLHLYGLLMAIVRRSGLCEVVLT